jgi:hypothetical protein
MARPIVISVIPAKAASGHVLILLFRQQQDEGRLLGKFHQTGFIVKRGGTLTAAVQRDDQRQPRSGFCGPMQVHVQVARVLSEVGNQFGGERGLS